MAAAVSIIVPSYNEADTIGLLIDAIARQDVPLGDLEVILADGMSQDDTRRAAQQAAARHPGLSLRIIDNPDRNIPSALNRALRAASGATLIRLDAHSIPATDYVQRCLDALRETGAANVGGQWDIRPSSPRTVARSIAEAGSHPLGAGDARYRTGGAAGTVDTVPFGAFPRRWLELVGGYDETLLTNEDYELNLRLRRAGGKIWFDPGIRSAYFARENLPALARQYFRYGFWKGRVVLRHPGSLRWRQAAAPLLVLASVTLCALSPWFAAARGLLALELGAYALLLVAAGIERAFRRNEAGLSWGLPLALATIHGSWGAGFWWGVLTGLAGSDVDRKSSET
jgi:succinoglycan biosynthesis protein ExoA